jgi:hypothetical protein
MSGRSYIKRDELTEDIASDKFGFGLALLEPNIYLSVIELVVARVHDILCS